MSKNKKHPLTHFREQAENRYKAISSSLPKANFGYAVDSSDDDDDDDKEKKQKTPEEAYADMQKKVNTMNQNWFKEQADKRKEMELADMERRQRVVDSINSSARSSSPYTPSGQAFAKKGLSVRSKNKKRK